MTVLTEENFQEIVLAEYDVLEEPTGISRRHGAEDGAGMWAAMGRLDGIYELLENGKIDTDKATKDITDAILELASSLYAAGAEHELWRHWISLTCFGMYLSGQIHQAAQYAAIAGEWDFIQVLPPSPVTSQQVSEKVIWQLLGGQPTPNFPNLLSNQIDADDTAWLTLIESIPNRDNENTEAALKTIAAFWMSELEDWMDYIPDNYPYFQPTACAAAALARHHGLFTSTSFSAEEYNFLEAGLALSKPSPMYPNIFSLPRLPRAENKTQ